MSKINKRLEDSYPVGDGKGRYRYVGKPHRKLLKKLMSKKARKSKYLDETSIRRDTFEPKIFHVYWW